MTANQTFQNQPDDGAFLSGAIKPRPLSRMTYKILSFNLLVIFILAMGVSYLGSARKNLIEAKLNNLESETFLYSKILSGGLTQQSLDPKILDPFILQLNQRNEQKILVYTLSGNVLTEVGALPQRKVYGFEQRDDLNAFEKSLQSILDIFSVTFHLPLLPDLRNAQELSKGEQSAGPNNTRLAAWSAEDGGLILTAYAPLYKNGRQVASLRVVRRNLDVEQSFASTRLEVLRFLVISMLLTLTHSLYLAGLIGHPLRKLATAAEAYRLSRRHQVEIPDMSDRQDEIGELSHAMREMAKSLQDRLSAIEQFAADVSHELKNPLTSLRSALETLPRAKNEGDRERLMAVVFHDLKRIDRLISDISQASRLDAELSRNELILIDLRDIILPLIKSHQDPIHLGGGHSPKDRIVSFGLEDPVYILGQSGRLEQVFQNLIDNALSFAPEGTQVIVNVDHNPERVKIIIDDFGPGIPENRLEKVFERFYSERPVKEGFGMHSGLGLSIAKQIIDAHGGFISAENRRDKGGIVLGARFIVKLRGADKQ